MKPNLDYIVEQLRPLAVPIETLSLDPENARIHPERNLDEIRKSLQRFGQRLPIVVQAAGMIVRAGNGRLTVARELGWTHIAAVVCDDDAGVAKAFALMDNRSAELAEWNQEQLTLLISSLSYDSKLLDVTGFNSDELKQLLDPPTPEHPPEEFREVDMNVETQYSCPKCSYKWSGKPS